MKIDLALDFSVDKENKTITIKREFAAEIPLVWKAFTTSEILDQWWAPKPWKTRTKTMDFREGGQWHYSMFGPEGDEHWAVIKYLTIEIENSFTAIDSFSDIDGNINNDLPGAHWATDFSTSENGSLVMFLLTFEDLKQLEWMVQMGFKEGFISALENLDEYFLKLNNN